MPNSPTNKKKPSKKREITVWLYEWYGSPGKNNENLQLTFQRADRKALKSLKVKEYKATLTYSPHS